MEISEFKTPKKKKIESIVKRELVCSAHTHNRTPSTPNLLSTKKIIQKQTKNDAK